MNKVSRMAAVGGLVTLSLALSGCQNMTAPAAPQKAPEVVLQEGMNKLADVTSYGYNVTLGGDLHAPTSATGEAQKPENIKINVNLSGGVDLKVAKDPRMNLVVKGSVMADTDGGNGEFAVRMNKDAIFASVVSLVGQGTVQIPEEMKTEILGKWWTMPVPPAALEELAKTVPQGDQTTMTPEQKKLKDLVQNTKFFKDVKFVAMEDVGGEQSSHYSAALDEVAFSNFVAAASEIQGQPMTESDKADMKDAMSYMTFSGDMYIGKDSGILNKMKGTLSFKQGGKKPAPTGNVTLEVMLSGLNKPVTVEVPKDAQPIPMDALSSLPL